MAFIHKKPLTIILGFLVVLQLSLYYYYNLSLDREYRALTADLSSHAIMLTSNMEERASIVKGVSSFIQTVGFDASPTTINQYLATAYANSGNVMNIVIAPEGIIRYLHPLSGNTGILNKSLLLDPSLSSPGLIKETLRTRAITVDGPRTLAQGNYGMVIRQAIYKEDNFAGIVSVTLRIDDIMEQLLSKDSPVYVSAQNGSFLFGKQPPEGSQQIIVPIQVYNQHWLMGIEIPPGQKWAVLQDILWIDIIFLFILAFILYFT
jgi:sensor domain CHASE-containing protein